MNQENKIKIMDEVLSNKIAAGEVVEKTMNVVKELVENSIDANSDEITIKLIDSGVKEITVIDNGGGMSRNDATLAFSRHATSKLTSIDDLFNIESLGFRGEALPSIASVSKVVLKTSINNEGTLVTIDGGKNMQVENSSLIKGTTISVQNLFYNTPVRLKYLKNLYIELAHISEYINKMALSFPNIKFKLINNDKVLLETSGNGDLLKVIYNIYGVDVTKKMIEITAENDDYYINGYISYPEIYKSNRGSITTLVNGRIIKNIELNKVILEAYHTYLPIGKYPVVVLNINVDPILIDINIHPTKMDIKFSKFDKLKELVFQGINNSLNKNSLIPKVEVPIIERPTFEKNIIVNEKKYEEINLELSIKESKEDYNLVKIKPMIPRGLVYLTYIIAENEDGMYIIDHHAAAERINYEKYLKELTNPNNHTQNLLVPIKLEFPSNEYLILKENLHLLEKLNIEIEEFGINTILVRSHPVWLKEGYEEESIRKIINSIIEKEKFEIKELVEKTAITLSCRLSIKANEYTNYDEQERLLNDLIKCDQPYTCPHGRPTVIKYTKYELEKMFKRALD